MTDEDDYDTDIDCPHFTDDRTCMECVARADVEAVFADE